MKAAWRPATALAAMLVAAACGQGGEPQVTVSELSWACGTARCTATFRLTAGQSRRVTASVDTDRPANRMRVIVLRAR